MVRQVIWQGVAALALALAALVPAAAGADRLTVFAAASLKGALDEIAAGFQSATGHHVTLVYAGSSVLARQIEAGAPADLFVSANAGWMDALARDRLIAAETRADLVSNTLVVIAPATDAAASAPDVAASLGGGRIAMALVDAVPAGLYGRAALEHLGLWTTVAPRVVQADNVRAALAFVALGEVPRGIVYGSDAQAEPRVRVLATFPADSHPPIRYPAAALAGRDGPAVRALLDHLRGPEAARLFGRHGFVVPGS